MHNHKIESQERMVDANLSCISIQLKGYLEDLESDCTETFELSLGEVQIYVDVATRGWDYRSIELIAVDIMNAECEALNKSARKLYAILLDTIDRLNLEMNELYESRDIYF